MSVFQYEQQLADLSNKYNQDQAAQEYGRFISQQRFNRGLSDMNKGFQQSFPKFTGQYARRLGSNVRSGRLGADMTDMTNRYTTQVGDLQTQQAGFESQYAADQARRQAAYQRALLMLQEQMAAERAAQDPFAVLPSGGA